MGDVTKAAQNVGNYLKNQMGQDITNDLGGGDGAKYLGGVGRAVGQLAGTIPGLIGGGDNKPPDAPGVDPQLNAVKDQQIQQAKDFRSNLPSMQSQLAQKLAGQSNRNMSANVNQIQNSNSARGLGYGGLNQGMKQQERATDQASLAQGVSNVNTGLQSAANQLDASAIQTGVGIQSSNQQIQNQIYSQAMAKQQADNSVTGSLLGAAAIGFLA